ncbi:MAG TPA: hypothetical protein VNJ53_01115 [Gaiellaceae bacterium]|nr:hypothetical protein [Gaiellaceae bacterium]
MVRVLRKRPSPATVVASVALLAALGGTGVAAIETVPRGSVGTVHLRQGAVTSAKIADGAVTSADVRNRSLRRVDFAPGQLPRGPIGPQGPQGAPGLSGREEVAAETATTSVSPKAISASCPAGKKVVGGGIEVGGPGRGRVTVTENQPAGDAAWEAEAFEAVATGAAWKLEVHAICATVAP